MTFQERLNKAIGPDDKVTLSRTGTVSIGSHYVRVEYETHHETLGPLMHPEYIDSDNVTPGKLVSAIETAKKHIQSAVEVVTRTRENGQKETPDDSA